jgi:hypothetical protein
MLPLSDPPLPSELYARRKDRPAGVRKWVNVELLTFIAAAPRTIQEIEAIKRHKELGGLIWPAKMVEFHRETATYHLLRKGRDYLTTLRAANLLP